MSPPILSHVVHRRLHAYAMVAVTPLAGADIIGETGLHLVVTPDTPVAIDFGPGFGEVIEFLTRDDHSSFHSGSGGSCQSSRHSTNHQREARMRLRDNAPGHRLSAIAFLGFWVDQLDEGFVVEATPDHPNG
ncbi:MAG: hypothetical protein KDA28_14715 [Phycisphaerales bacterium]|nr:hypothetical protein [Phycisphaerales bacterium]